MILKDYLESENMRAKHFAEILGTSSVYLCHIMKGRRKVGRNLAKKIERVTNGKVSRLEALYPEDFEEDTPGGKQMRLAPKIEGKSKKRRNNDAGFNDV